MAAYLTRCNLVHDVGYIEYGSTSSMEMLVIADEIIRNVRFIMNGVEVGERTLARDVIHGVKPGAGFLNVSHTRDSFRWAQFRPDIIDRSHYGQWVKEGSKDMSTRANERARQILSEHEVPKLSAAAEEEIAEVFRRRERST